jgi:MFS family permease
VRPVRTCSGKITAPTLTIDLELIRVRGQCYGQFDAKYVYILCVLIFEVGSAVCGSAPNMNALIVGRAICGLGGAGMYTGVMVLISATTLEHERPIYFGFTGLTWGTGTILGPILGGVFTDSSATWRWVCQNSCAVEIEANGLLQAFYINLVIGGVCAPIYLFLLPSSRPMVEGSVMKRLSTIDITGTILLCGTFAAGIMGISFGGALYPWNSGKIIGLLVTAGVLTILFFIQQILAIGTSATTRLFPLPFLRSPIMIMMFLATACASTAIFVPVYFVPLYYQFVHQNSALQAGVKLLPYVCFNVAFAMINGGAMSKKPYYMPWYVFAGALCTAGSVLMYTVDEYTSNAKIWGYTILLGAGAGAFVQLSFTVIQQKVEKNKTPVAVGFLTFAQLVGPAVALCISNAVFLNEAVAGVQDKIPKMPRERILTMISSASTDLITGMSADQRGETIRVIVKAISKPYVLSMTAGIMTLIMSVLMKPEKLQMK